MFFANALIAAVERLAIFGGKLILAVDRVGDYGIQIDEEFVSNALDMETKETEMPFSLTTAASQTPISKARYSLWR